jgi:hypothetical protein
MANDWNNTYHNARRQMEARMAAAAQHRLAQQAQKRQAPARRTPAALWEKLPVLLTWLRSATQRNRPPVIIREALSR